MSTSQPPSNSSSANNKTSTESSASAAKTTSAQERSGYGRMRWFAVFGSLALVAIIFSLSKVQNLDLLPSQLPAPDIRPTHRLKAPQFQGQQFSSQDLLGRWHLLSFWAHWCVPCLKELPTLNTLAEQWAGPELEIVLINQDQANSEDLVLAQQFIAANNISLRTVYDAQGSLKTAFAITQLPSHALINPNGEIIWQDIGAYDWSSEETKQKLLMLLEHAEIQPAEESEESIPPDE